MDEKLNNADYRKAYVSAWARQIIAIQVYQGRKGRKWSQAELGRRCGMKQSVIARIEREKAALTVNVLLRLAEAFGGALWVELMPLDEFSARTRCSFSTLPASPQRRGTEAI